MKTPVPNGLLRVQKQVDLRLHAFFDEKLKVAARDGDKDEQFLHEAMSEYALRGGKRLRSYLVEIGFRMTGKKFSEPACIEIGCALELLHAALLIHDDIIDEDDVRRGKPALHVTLSKHFGSKEAGERAAILCGDTLTSYALEIILLSDFPNARKVEAARILANFTTITGIGEAMDVLYSFSGDLKPTLSQKIAQLKTAKYSVSGPVLVGYILGGGKRFRKKIESFCDSLGTAFQIHDDTLGLFGKKYLDNMGSDVRGGRPTLARTLVVRANKDQKASVLDQKEAYSLPEIETYAKLIRESDTEEQGKKTIKRLVANARTTLTSLWIPTPVRADIESTIEYIIQRDV